MRKTLLASVVRIAVSLGTCTALVGNARTAGAQGAPAKSAAEQRALDLFDKSLAAYRAGRFQDAVNLLREAYTLKAEPVLLYNLGRAYEGLGDLSGALQAYSDYLVAQPNAPDRGGIETRVATLRQQIADRQKLERARAEAEATARLASQTRSPVVVPWVIAGVGYAGLATGVVFGLLALSKHSSAESDPVQLNAVSEQSTAKTFSTVANVALIAGGTLAVGGTVWGILASRRSTEARPAAAATGLSSDVRVGPTSASVVLHW